MTPIPRLLQRATAKEVTQASTMAATLAALEASELVTEYHEMMEFAPRRGKDGHAYFVEHSGRPPQGEDERRREERLAMALVNDQASLSAGGEAINLLMYAFPLYTSGGPRGTRAVDLVGYATETRRFWVAELKIAANSKRYGQTPLRALYEALVYGAIVEANMAHITSELEDQGRSAGHLRPGLVITAPDDFWERWTPNPRIGDWWTPYRSITRALSEEFQTPLATVALGRVSYKVDDAGKPRLGGQLECRAVDYL
jgi:hypothetical protein